MKTAFYIISSFLLLSSCHKDYSIEGRLQDSTQVVTDTTVADSSYFFDMIIDGKREFHVAGKDGFDATIDGMSMSGPGSSAIGSMSMDGSVQGAHGPIPALTLYRGAISAAATDTTFALRKQRVLSGFAPGEYLYTAQPYVLSGVYFRWIDRQDKEWRTSWGNGNQNGNSFRIVSSFPAYHSNGVLIGVVYFCTFNCTLYDNGGKSIKIENGRLRYGMIM